MKINNETEAQLYLTQKAVEELDASIAKTKNKVKEVMNAINNSRIGTPKYNSLIIELGAENSRLDWLLAAKKRVVIVEKEYDSDIINIGDIVTVDFMYSEDDTEELSFKLVLGEGELDGEEALVSVNSPLGKAVLNETLGTTVSYKVGESEVKVLIRTKKTLAEDNTAPSRK